jgi:hypothetical protein
VRRRACAALAAALAGCSSANGAGGGDAAGRDAGSDATVTGGEDAGGGPDASSPGSDAGPGLDASCGAFAGDTTFTCTGDGTARAKCEGGGLVEQACAEGCLRLDAGQDSICMGDASDWSCTGAYGTTPVDDGDYFLSEFGCYVDDAGVQTDPGDNCIPSCLAQAQASGLCAAGSTGPECEESVNWYTADGARFGCLQRLRVTNPATGKALIAVALDFGPGCTGENNVQHAVLDSSGPVNDYLFGSAQGASQGSLVHVVEVDDATPLGPVP